jgi:hypothetical protein
VNDSRPRPPAGLRHLRRLRGRRNADAIRATPSTIRTLLGAIAGPRRAGGPWRVAVAEASMAPTLEPGDWLLVDPTTRRWPRPGSVVIVRDPSDDGLSIKRIAAGPGTRVPFSDGFLHLGPDEAWLLADADESLTAERGFGPPVDSRRYGPVPLERLVGRAWFRYGPVRRAGRIGRAPRARGGLRPSQRSRPERARPG